MTSPDGINWTLRTPSADILWSSVTYGNGLFVAVAQDLSGNVIMTSPDGITWTARTPPANNTWNGVTFGNGIFVAVGSSGTGNRVMRSTDGITWTTQSSASNITWRSVTYGKGLFVAIGFSGSNVVMTSPDGITWTGRSLSISGWRSVCYGNGMFVAVAAGISEPPAAVTSVDGISWVTRNTPNFNYYSVVYGNGMFVSVGSNDLCMTSGVINTTVTPHNNQYNGTHYFTQNVMIGSNAAPQRTLHVTGEVRITDLITDNPTKLVGVDNEGDLSEITLGTGLSFSGTTLNAGASATKQYAEIHLTNTQTIPASGLGSANTNYEIGSSTVPYTLSVNTSEFSLENSNRLK
jgi:hypothetical protein